MMNLQARLGAFVQLGIQLKAMVEVEYNDQSSDFYKMLNSAFTSNKWFTPASQVKALESLALMLQEKELSNWVSNYNLESGTSNSNKSGKPKTISLICAGNIPAVAFHDFMCVLISGNKAQLKFSTDDNVLFPFIVERLLKIEPRFVDFIQVLQRTSNPDAVIATGSNNSARYFNYYFGKYPHIIRKNRNSIAVLSGNETVADFKKLAMDIFSYFGLGCRNVSKLMVPKGYNFNLFFESIEELGAEIMNHNKYMNNYDYHKALFLLEAIPFLTNNFLILRENNQIATPVSVIHFEFYPNTEELKHNLALHLEQIQCIVSQNKILGAEISFGNTQQPVIGDYADGVDTMQFLLAL